MISFLAIAGQAGAANIFDLLGKTPSEMPLDLLGTLKSKQYAAVFGESVSAAELGQLTEASAASFKHPFTLTNAYYTPKDGSSESESFHTVSFTNGRSSRIDLTGSDHSQPWAMTVEKQTGLSMQDFEYKTSGSKYNLLEVTLRGRAEKIKGKIVQVSQYVYYDDSGPVYMVNYTVEEPSVQPAVDSATPENRITLSCQPDGTVGSFTISMPGKTPEEVLKLSGIPESDCRKTERKKQEWEGTDSTNWDIEFTAGPLAGRTGTLFTSTSLKLSSVSIDSAKK